MREKTGIFIMINMLFLIGTTTALIPDVSTVSISNSWVVANSVDRTTITVTGLNVSAAPGHFTGPVENALVTFMVENPALESNRGKCC